MANTPLRQGVRGGYQAAKELLKNLDQDSNRYKRNVFYDPEFRQGLQTAGINVKETPGAFLGAYSARLGADLTSDEMRNFYWGISHPAEISNQIFKKNVDPQNQLGRYGRGIVSLAAVQPALALTGAYNVLNLGELGRPTGFKQNEPDPEDPTKTTNPASELFQRFFLGRTGRPLAYEKAKEEIPDLTKQRYANYMNFLYNDPGPIGQATLGLVKVTPENLQGDPEARILGYPVSIPYAGTLAGGVLGARIGVNKSPSVTQTVQPSLLAGQKAEVSRAMTKRTPSIVRGLAGGAVGSAAGAVIGTLTNQAIAAAGNSMNKLPTQQEYQNISAGRI